MGDTIPSFDEIMEAQNIAIAMQHQHWLHKELFTFQFWLILFMLLVPWILWWKLVDKRRLVEILLYGSLVQTVVTVIDEVGCQLNLWEYPFDIEPLFPRFIPANLTVLPIVFMLLYQFIPRWKPYVIMSTLLASVFSFLMEPLLSWLGIYKLFQWKYIYSFPIYIFLFILFKWLMELIKAKQLQVRTRKEP